jgi:hypothetical protein
MVQDRFENPIPRGINCAISDIGKDRRDCDLLSLSLARRHGYMEDEV